MINNNFVDDRIFLLKTLRKNGLKLKTGELLLLKGLITEEQLSEALIKQTLVKKSGKKIALGNILVSLGYISNEEIIDFLERENNKLPLKDKLVNNGIVTDEFLEGKENITDGDLLNLLFIDKSIDNKLLYDLVDDYGEYIKV